MTTKKLGRMGLHQMYWRWRTTMVTTVPSMLSKQLLVTTNQTALPLYIEVVTQLRARVPHQRAAPTQTSAGPTLFDKEDTPEEVASHKQRTRLGLERKYAKPETWVQAPNPTPQ